MAKPEDERDEDLDTEDADLEDENSDDEEDEEDEDDSDDDEDEDDPDDSDEEDEDDDKPVTRKELKKFLQSNKNKENAKRRVSSKKRDISKPSRSNDRLDRIEQSVKKTELLERKRSFGYENSLSPKEVDIVFKLSKRPTKKFLDLPYVKGAIAAVRAESNVRSNTPSTNGRNFQANGKAWKDMDSSERQSNFADKRRTILESKKNR